MFKRLKSVELADEDFAAERPSDLEPWDVDFSWLCADSDAYSDEELAPIVAEICECDPPLKHIFVRAPRDYFPTFRRIGQTAVSTGGGLLHAAQRSLALPGNLYRWLKNVPSGIHRWFVTRPWQEMLAVRKGFLVGALSGFSIVGSTLWALSSLPYLPGHPIEPVVSPVPAFPTAHLSVPPELAWFFIQY